MASAEKVSIGFSGGGVVEVKIDAAKLKDLRKALDKANGFIDLETEDGVVSINLSEVIFLRASGAHQSIGFGG